MGKKPVNIEVYVKRGEPVERAIKRFNKKVKKEGIIEGVIKRKRYEKPSAVRHRKKVHRQRLIDKQNELIREEERNLYKRKNLKPKNKNRNRNRRSRR